jgi:hypothetical protein
MPMFYCVMLMNSAVLYIINFVNCYQNGPISSYPSLLPAIQRCQLKWRVQYEIVSGRLSTFYNFLVSTRGKLLVFLVNYAHYTTFFYYEKVRQEVLWEVRNALCVFPLFVMGKIVLTYDQLGLRPAIANELSS